MKEISINFKKVWFFLIFMIISTIIVVDFFLSHFDIFDMKILNKLLVWFWIFIFSVIWFWNFIWAQEADPCPEGMHWDSEFESCSLPDVVVTPTCDWIKLNTNIPFLWNCIEASDANKALPVTLWALTKLVMSIILIVCFILIIVAGILWASSWNGTKWVTEARKILEKVAWTMALIWMSWAILRLINPNFFG